MGLPTFIEYSVLAVFFSSIVFLIGYTLIAPWWRYEIGRAMASLDICLMFAILPSALHYLFGFKVATNAFFGWYTGVSLYLCALVALWRLYVIWKINLHPESVK